MKSFYALIILTAVPWLVIFTGVHFALGAERNCAHVLKPPAQFMQPMPADVSVTAMKPIDALLLAALCRGAPGITKHNSCGCAIVLRREVYYIHTNTLADKRVLAHEAAHFAGWSGAHSGGRDW